ncbi:triosephosphate isomerase-like [Macrobrachium nipponense]|uniref:triosephosphate isomerase-like n=1 Tax=Macrobrachium nipponense TaxID=159736 RepID=UPI0030C83C4F
MTALSRKFVVVATLHKELSQASRTHMLQVLRGANPMNPSADLVIGSTKEVAHKLRHETYWNGSIALQDFSEDSRGEKGIAEMKRLAQWVVLDELDTDASSQVFRDKAALALGNGFKVTMRLGVLPNMNMEDNEGDLFDKIHLFKDLIKTYPNHIAIALETSGSSAKEKSVFLKETRKTLAKLRLWLRQNINQETAEQIQLLVSIPEKTVDLSALAQLPDLDGFFAESISSPFEVIQLVGASKYWTKHLWKKYLSVKRSTALIGNIRHKHFKSKVFTQCRCPKRYISML